MTHDGSQGREGEYLMRSVTFRLSQADLDRLRRIVKRRYPEDRNKTNQTIRELIREEDEGWPRRPPEGSGK